MSLFGYCQNYSYKQFTTEDGLPTNYVYGITEDKNGYIWAFTENGVSKFDGYEFKNFSVEEGLINNDIVYAEADSSGMLWLHGLQSHIQYIKNDRVFTFNDLKKDDFINHRRFHCNSDNATANFAVVKNNDITKILTLFDGKIVDSLNMIEIPDTSRFYKPDYLNSHFFPINKSRYCNISIDKSKYYEFYNDSLYTWNLNKFLNNSDSDFLSITTINTDNPFCIWSSSNQMIFLDIITRKKKKVIFSELLGSKPEEFSFQIKDDLLIFQSSLGYAEFDFEWNLKDLIIFEKELRQYKIKRSIKDSNGNLWVGTKDAGLLLFTSACLRNPILKTSIPYNLSFNKLYLNKEGKIFALADNAELCLIENEEITSLTKIDVTKKHVRNIRPGPNNNYFVSNGTKTVILDDTKTYELKDYPYFSNLEKDLGFKTIKYFRRFDDLYFDSKTDQLFGSYPSANAFVITKNEDHFRLKDLKVSGKFFFYDTFNDIKYLSNSEGLLKIDKNQETSLEFKLKAITSFLSIDKDTYLIGTEGAGLFSYKISSKKLTKINSHSFIRKISKENELFYLACNNGVAVGKIENEKWRNIYTFNKKDGLESEEIRDILINDKSIFATSFKGIIKLDKEIIAELKIHEENNLNSNALTLNKIVNITSQSIIKTANPVFEHNHNAIRFNYHLQNYDSYDEIFYEYKLEPIQKEWQITSDRNQAFFNLQAANYNLHLKATDAFGKEYYLQEPYSFKIKSPFWESWWFILICILIILSGIGIALKIKAKRSLREIEAEKELNNKITSFKIEALRSQMNPHFVFNALSSIQYYVQKNNAEKADLYLSMFGGLIRKYLDFSRVKTITLKQEIELLSDYIVLEKMRFESLFTSKMIVDPKLDIEDTYLPSMLIQPYIENAINHGLQQRRYGNGTLIIKFEKLNQDGLLISVSDNGIGIANSKSSKSGFHKSHGMNNIIDRISFLKESQELEIDLKVNTLSNHPQFPGTLILIRIEEL